MKFKHTSPWIDDEVRKLIKTREKYQTRTMHRSYAPSVVDLICGRSGYLHPQLIYSDICVYSKQPLDYNIMVIMAYYQEDLKKVSSRSDITLCQSLFLNYT